MSHLDFWSGPWSSRAIALGVAAGVLFGLVPKGNLTSLLIVAFVLLCRVNIVFGVGVGIAVSLVAGTLDPWAEQIGDFLLTQPWAQPVGQWLFSLPVLPWTSLDNTVVLGQFIIGCVLFGPVYIVVRRLIS